MTPMIRMAIISKYSIAQYFTSNNKGYKDNDKYEKYDKYDNSYDNNYDNGNHKQIILGYYNNNQSQNYGKKNYYKKNYY